MHAVRALALSFVSGGLLFGLADAAEAEWITFPATLGEALPQGIEDGSGRSANPVRGFLSVPVEPGPHPGVVLIHACDGRRPFHQSWAQALSGRGYVALLVDDFFMHDRYQTCGITDPEDNDDVQSTRLRNARAAARYLVGRPEVDGARLAVMGWGDAPVGDLIGDAERAEHGEQIFSAGVIITPAKCFDPDRPPPRPVLVLEAETDPNRSGEACDAPQSGSSLEVRIYEGTLPGFDNPQAEDTQASGAEQRRYHRLAHVRAINDVAQFFGTRLGSTSAAGGHDYAVSAPKVVSEVGTWAMDPNDAGPDLPPLGGSAFDAVFSRVTPEGVKHDIPFPFARLLQRLAHAAGGESLPRSPLDATLIPLGRSLQRDAAAPDYFQSPRIVVAVTGEPESGSGPIGIRLKNRLFLGYQPRSEVLEIISYNEAAARFEFQVVRNYGSANAPSARYSRRALCTSCHQNQAPMFPDASWGETDANEEVVRRLKGLGPEFHGVPVAISRAAVAIDIAADEASLLPVYQLLWSEGCASDNPKVTALCRAGALQAMFQYRLTESAGFDRQAPLYANGYLPVQQRNWLSRWPDGLLIPNANLPDRAPLMSPSPSVIPAALDPLRHRPPMDRWHVSSARDLERLVRGLSHELPDRHVLMLDQHLRDTAQSVLGRVLSAPCSVVRRGLTGRSRLLQIECGVAPDAAPSFKLRATIQVQADGVAEGEAGSLELDSSNYSRRTVVGRVEKIESGERIVLRLLDRHGRNAIRAPDGNTIESFTLSWDREVTESTARFDAIGKLIISGNFRRVSSMLDRLSASATAGSPLLGDRFDGIKLSGWLLAELGGLSDTSCCESKSMPEPRLEVDAVSSEASLSVALEHQGPLRTFSRYCGACHGSDTTFPPGFLHGEGDAILSAVTQCAERIYYRLSMWHRPPNEQAVPPMPPMQGLSLVRTTADNWRQSESLERLTAYVRGLIRGQNRDPDAMLEGPYHATRACLADPDLITESAEKQEPRS